MRSLRAHLAEIALIVSCVVLLLSAFLFKLNYDQGNDIKDVVDQIQQSRIVLSAQSCRQRNNERAITRSNLRQSKAQIARIPDAALEQLGFTRKEAVANIDRQLRQVRPLDCKKLIRQVAGNHVRGPVGGGGAGPVEGPRPPQHREASNGPQSPDGGSGAPGPQSPSEPPPQSGKPPSGGGGPTAPVNPPSGGPDGGVVTTPETPVIPNPDPGSIVQQVVDRVQSVVQQILPP